MPVILTRPKHNISRSLIDADALWIMKHLRREGFTACLVGGAVRDLLLGGEPKDFDIATDARPSQIKKLFRNSRIIGRRFRIVHVFFRKRGHPEKTIEVSTFRSGRKLHHDNDLPPEDLDHTGAAFGTPEEDAERRDFTINSLLYDISNFSIIDYAGGLEDLDNRRIKLIGDPDIRFPEDPVRMLRAVEFAVRLGFGIEKKTEEGIKKNAFLIVEASAARLREEFRQLQQRGIMGRVLAEAEKVGLLPYMLPEIEETKGLFELLEALDEAARSEAPENEASYMAALLLPTIAKQYEFDQNIKLEVAYKTISLPMESLTRRYHVSAHIRHLARELLLSCYRIAKGKAYRTKGKLIKKPEFSMAWKFIQVFSKVSGDLNETVAYWESYLIGQQINNRKKRKRRKPSRPGGIKSN